MLPFRVRRVSTAAVSFAWILLRIRFGIAEAANDKIIVTTINSPMSEKPLRLLWRAIMRSPVPSPKVPGSPLRRAERYSQQNSAAGGTQVCLKLRVEAVFYTGQAGMG